MEFLLLILSWLLKAELSALLALSGLIILAIKNRADFMPYCKRAAIIIDIFGCVIGGPLFNLILIKKGGYKFGCFTADGQLKIILETISYVMAMNKRQGTLSGFGLLLEKIINLFEKDHLEKTIIAHNLRHNLN